MLAISLTTTFQVERLKKISERKIESGKIEDTVREVTKRYNFTEEDHDGVLHNLIEGADLSQWGLVNAVTAFARDVDNHDKAYDMERVGGKIIDLTKDEWRQLAA